MTAASRQLAAARAFTLIEMTMSLLVLSVLIGALMGMMILTTDSLAAGQNRSERDLRLEVALNELRQDIEVALDMRFNGSDTITLSVPNRGVNGADAPEEIVYAVTGSAPSALTRSINGGAPETIATGVSGFSMTTAVSSFEGTGGEDIPDPVTSPETLLVANDVVLSNSGFTVDDKIWTAQTFEPSLPANTLSWTVTRVECRIEVARNRAELYSLQLRYAEPSGDPSEPSLGQVVLDASSAPTGWEWREFAFSGLPDFAAGEPLALVLGTESNGQANVKLAIVKDLDTLTPGAHVVSSNKGKKDTWSGGANGDDALFRVYGTYTTLGPPE